MTDKYISTKNALHNALEEGLQIIQMIQCVPKDGLKAYGLLKVAKHHQEIVPYLHDQYKKVADECLKHLTSIDNSYTKNQIKTINEDIHKYNVTSEKLLKLIDIELKKTAHNV